MGMSVSPDMFARSLTAAGQRAEGMHIRQSLSSHGITNILPALLQPA